MYAASSRKARAGAEGSTRHPALANHASATREREPPRLFCRATGGRPVSSELSARGASPIITPQMRQSDSSAGSNFCSPQHGQRSSAAGSNQSSWSNRSSGNVATSALRSLVGRRLGSQTYAVARRPATDPRDGKGKRASLRVEVIPAPELLLSAVRAIEGKLRVLAGQLCSLSQPTPSALHGHRCALLADQLTAARVGVHGARHRKTSTG